MARDVRTTQYVVELSELVRQTLTHVTVNSILVRVQRYPWRVVSTHETQSQLQWWTSYACTMSLQRNLLSN